MRRKSDGVGNERVDRNVSRSVVEFIDARFEAVMCIAFSGSRVAGVPDPFSDFDVQVIHPGHWWQKVNVRLADVDVDLAIGPPEYFNHSLASNNVRLAHMLASCTIERDTDGLLERLIATAENVLKRHAEYRHLRSPFDHAMRHRPVTLLRNVRALALNRDILGTDYASMVAVDAALRAWIAKIHRPLEAKHLVGYLRSNQPEINALFEQFLKAAGDCDRRAALCEDLVERIFTDLGGLSSHGETERIPWQKAVAFMA